MSKQQHRVKLTAGRVETFTCPAGKSQAFLWDTEAPALALRVTPTGRKTYVFESRLNGATLRINIGTAADWPIKKAQTEAQRLKMLVDSGQDPREIERQQQADKAAAQAAAVAQVAVERQNAVTVAEAWATYLEARRPFWGERNYADHLKLADAGGTPRARLPGVATKAGPLAALMRLELRHLDSQVIEAWATREAQDRPARVRLALRLLKAFLRWASNEPSFKGRADPTAASAKKVREVAGRAKAKNDYLQREQLAAWFTAVQQIPNPVISAYLQCLLLTGARREELAALRWDDVNFQWRGMSMKDKIEGERAVPLTAYVCRLLQSLPKRSEWVFSSTTSASGRLMEPSIAHRQACAVAGLELTLHGLRRSFASLCEWLDIPGGISAQIQGHAPQGVREQNYIRRPLDLLRVHHERIEAWILEQAGVTFDRKAEPGKLALVA